SKKFSFAEWTAAGMDTKVGLAERNIPLILAVFDKLKAADPARAAKIADMVEELRRWGQGARIDSIPTTLFVLGANNDAIPGLEPVKARLEKDWGTWRVAWGDINRLQRVHSSGTQEPFSDDRPSVPVPGAPSFSGTIFTFGARQARGQKRNYGTVGDTYVAVVEFGKRPVTRSLLVSGQSADPKSPHYFDQAPLYSRGEFKEAWFEKSDVRKHAERSYRLDRVPRASRTSSVRSIDRAIAR